VRYTKPLTSFPNATLSLHNNANPVAYWLLYRIFTHKDSLARLRAEVGPAFGNGDSVTTLEQLQHLLNCCPLLRAFYDETLRFHSTNSSNRRVVEEASVGGYTLKVGNNIICPPYAQHHSEEFFGKGTDKFDPERFIKPVLANGTQANAKMVRAFGGGVSLCPGRFFASNEVLSYAASVLWRYDITSKGGGMVSIVRRKRG
jgi:cytochrome P450